VRVLLVGPPGAGKGTQARVLAERMGALHIASGDLLREAIDRETPLGKQAKSYIQRGDLVPDDVVVGVVAERLKRPDAESFVLDGFPRTEAQARELGRVLGDLDRPLDIVVHLEAPDDEIVARLSGRRLCSRCQRAYHVVHDPPREPGKCDDDGAELVSRPDDDPETVRHRLRVQYHEPIRGLLDFYRDAGLVVPIDGVGPVEDVTERIAKAVEVTP
jgi:adenylate kinase